MREREEVAEAVKPAASREGAVDGPDEQHKKRHIHQQRPN